MKENEILPRQLTPMIVVFAAVILLTIIIGSWKQLRGEQQTVPGTEENLRLELSPFAYSGRKREVRKTEKRTMPSLEQTAYFASIDCENGNFPEAEDRLKTALVFYPRDQRLLSMLGSVYYQQGQYRQAEMIFRRLAFLHPDDQSAYNNLGLALAKQKRFSEAITTMENLLKKVPDSPTVRINLSGMYAVSGNKNEAILYFRKAYETLGERILPLSYDSNFDNIRQEPAFRRIVREAQKTANEKWKYEVKQHE